MTSVELENVFSYHSPKNDQPVKYETIRKHARNFATYIAEECPDSREKSIAITKLQECVMWANASIAINE